MNSPKLITNKIVVTSLKIKDPFLFYVESICESMKYSRYFVPSL